MLLKQVCGLTAFASSMSAHYGKKKADKKEKGTPSELNVLCCELKPWLWEKKQQIIPNNSPTAFVVIPEPLVFSCEPPP